MPDSTERKLGNLPTITYPIQEQQGYDKVGPGWTPLLEALDETFTDILYSVIQNDRVAGVSFNENQNTEKPSVRILQVKEKFGGLRIYWKTEGVSHEFYQEIRGAVHLAEVLSLKTCERCGAPGTQVETEVGPGNRMKWGRVLTLCERHHAERRENKVEGKKFDLGNGDEVC